jgi:hypothetical protein
MHTKSFLINLDYMPQNSLEFLFEFIIYKVQHRYLLRVNHHKFYSREEKSAIDKPCDHSQLAKR